MKWHRWRCKAALIIDLIEDLWTGAVFSRSFSLGYKVVGLKKLLRCGPRILNRNINFVEWWMGLYSIEVCWLFATVHKLTNEINVAFNTIHHHNHNHHPSGVRPWQTCFGLFNSLFKGLLSRLRPILKYVILTAVSWISTRVLCTWPTKCF
jgi:hypothetical protein